MLDLFLKNFENRYTAHISSIAIPTSCTEPSSSSCFLVYYNTQDYNIHTSLVSSHNHIPCIYFYDILFIHLMLLCLTFLHMLEFYVFSNPLQPSSFLFTINTMYHFFITFLFLLCYKLINLLVHHLDHFIFDTKFIDFERFDKL